MINFFFFAQTEPSRTQCTTSDPIKIHKTQVGNIDLFLVTVWCVKTAVGRFIKEHPCKKSGVQGRNETI